MTLNLLMIIILAVLIVLFLLFVGECFKTWSDFFKCFGFHPNLRYRCLFFILRRAKNLRFVKNFPLDLRKACLDNDSIYAIDEKDSPKIKDAKKFAQKVLQKDSILNRYFKGHYLTYANYLDIEEKLKESPEPSIVQKNALIDELKHHLKDRRIAELLFNLIYKEIKTPTEEEFTLSRKYAAIYKSLLALNEVTSFPISDFALFIQHLSLYDIEIESRSASSISASSKEIAPKENIPLFNYYKNFLEKVSNEIRRFTASYH